MNQSDRHVEGLLQIAAEEIADRGEAADRRRTALHPLAGHIRLRRRLRVLRHGKQADHRVLRLGDVLLGIGIELTDISMLDWPLQIQTSPTRTFLIVTVFLPLMVSV